MIILTTIIITGIILLFIWGSCRLASISDDARDEFWREMLEGKRESEEICPVCGYYCLGKGGIGCIDKPGRK
ncbi:MAG: hypothetical protein KAQ99_08795 [Candidatus Aureabacteria bacterium]|nr:hypothetical protein [Candidatus Auribacterota bacterium]